MSVLRKELGTHRPITRCRKDSELRVLVILDTREDPNRALEFADIDQMAAGFHMTARMTLVTVRVTEYNYVPVNVCYLNAALKKAFGNRIVVRVLSVKYTDADCLEEDPVDPSGYRRLHDFFRGNKDN